MNGNFAVLSETNSVVWPHFNVVICHKEIEKRPGIEEEGIYLC